jgi:hypothetical protein
MEKGKKYEKYRFVVNHHRNLVSVAGIYPAEIGYFDMSAKFLSGDRQKSENRRGNFGK